MKLSRLRLLSEHRAAKRYPILCPAKLHGRHGDKAAHVLNLSIGGVMAYTRVPPPVGERLGITFAGEPVVGEVVWSRRSHFGVKLLTPLLSEAIAKIIKVSEAAY